MENAITAGLSRQIVLARALEATANNIANQTTAGFKGERVAFREYLARLEGSPADPFVSLVYDAESYTDFAPGALESSYAPLDFAIDGGGFFAVETDEGVAYTRDGRFSLNDFGELVTRSGARVLDAGGASILIDPELAPPVMTPNGELQQDGSTVARLGVYRFEDNTALMRRGENLFEAFDEPETVESPRLKQGFVETSNVVSIAAMTDMIEITRAYQQAARVVETSDEMARQAIRTLSEKA